MTKGHDSRLSCPQEWKQKRCKHIANHYFVSGQLYPVTRTTSQSHPVWAIFNTPQIFDKGFGPCVTCKRGLARSRQWQKVLPRACSWSQSFGSWSMPRLLTACQGWDRHIPPCTFAEDRDVPLQVPCEKRIPRQGEWMRISGRFKERQWESPLKQERKGNREEKRGEERAARFSFFVCLSPTSAGRRLSSLFPTN